MASVELHSGEAVAAFLSEQYPDNTAKRVAALLPEVSVRTIEGWLQGKRPNGTHMDMLVALFGIGFVKSVWGAVLGPLEPLEAIERLRNVESEIAALRKTLAGHMDQTQGELPLAQK